MDGIKQKINDLEKSITRYKEEYAALISEAQAIKTDLGAVEAKVLLVFHFLQYFLIPNDEYFNDDFGDFKNSL